MPAVDCFKQINGLHGHAAGDARLQDVLARAGAALHEAERLGRNRLEPAAPAVLAATALSAAA